MEEIEITVVGAGKFGTGLSQALIRNPWVKRIDIKARRKEIREEINSRHQNSRYLKGVKLDKKITASPFRFDDIGEKNIVIIAVPSYAQRKVYEEWKAYYRRQRIIGTSKGIEIRIEGETLKSLMFSHQVAEEKLGEIEYWHLSGPAFADEIARGKETTNVLASRDFYSAKNLAETLSTKSFKLEPSDDLIGAEFAGPAKNYIAAAMGRLDDQAPAEVTRATRFVELILEMIELGGKIGVQPQTVFGPAYLGDAFLSISPKSRSYRSGLGLLKRIKKRSSQPTFESPLTLKEWKIAFDFGVFFKDLEYLLLLEPGLEAENVGPKEKIIEAEVSIYSLYRMSEKFGLRLPRLKEVFDIYFKRKKESPEEIIKKLLKEV